MECASFEAEEYGLYALGNLQGESRDRIAAHLDANCANCKAEVANYRMLWPRLSVTAPPVKIPSGLRSRVILSVGGRTSWWTMQWPAFAASAAVALVAVSGWFLVRKPAPSIAFSPAYRVEIPAPATTPPPTVETIIKKVPVPVEKTIERTVDNPAQAAAIAALNQDLARERQRTAELSANLTAAQRALSEAPKAGLNTSDDAQRRVAALSARAQELERQVAQYRVLLETERKRSDQSLLLASMVSDPSLRVLKLRATEKSQSVEGHALIAGNSQMVFYASHLPALPANRVYQLWLIRDNGQPIASAGIFTPENATVQLRNPALLQGLTTIAVTDEPAGGSAQPTGHKWLVGT